MENKLRPSLIRPEVNNLYDDTGEISLGWDEDKRVLINNLLLHSDNPRIINY